MSTQIDKINGTILTSNAVSEIDAEQPHNLGLQLLGVNVQQHDSKQYSVVVTLCNNNITIESRPFLCASNNSTELLEATVWAVVDAVINFVSTLLCFNFFEVHQYTLEDFQQQFVTVVLGVNEGSKTKSLPGIAEVVDADLAQAAACATLDALNHKLVPNLNESFDIVDQVFKRRRRSYWQRLYTTRRMRNARLDIL